MTDLSIVKMEEFQVGFDRMKRAKLELAGRVDLYEYRNADLDLANLSIRDVLPCSYYALKYRLEFLRRYRTRLQAELGLSLFDLPGILYIRDGNKTFGLVPPFVEVYVEEDGREVQALQDGIHRLLLGAEFGVKQRCILIRNIQASRKYLPYAYPNSWEDVEVLDKVPTLKKRYRRVPPYSFMRPLRSIFDSRLVKDWADYGRK